ERQTWGKHRGFESGEPTECHAKIAISRQEFDPPRAQELAEPVGALRLSRMRENKPTVVHDNHTLPDETRERSNGARHPFAREHHFAQITMKIVEALKLTVPGRCEVGR